MTMSEEGDTPKNDTSGFQYVDFANASEEDVTELAEDIHNTSSVKEVDEKKARGNTVSVEGDEVSLSSEEDADVSSNISKVEKKRPKINLNTPRGGVYEPFPVKLYQMLVASEVIGFQNLISWRPHGRSFKVHNPDAFVRQILPVYTRQTKLTSFSRQLNLYGFRRCTRGSDTGAYYHEKFLRGKALLARTMLRTKVKGALNCRLNSAESFEPNFYKDFPPLPPLSSLDSKGESLMSDKDKIRSIYLKRSKSCDESTDLREEKRSRHQDYQHSPLTLGVPMYPQQMSHHGQYQSLPPMQHMPAPVTSSFDYGSYSGHSPSYNGWQYPPHHYHHGSETPMRSVSEGYVTPPTYTDVTSSSSQHNCELPVSSGLHQGAQIIEPVMDRRVSFDSSSQVSGTAAPTSDYVNIFSPFVDKNSLIKEDNVTSMSIPVTPTYSDHSTLGDVDGESLQILLKILNED